MNPSLDYDVTTCRYALGSREHNYLFFLPKIAGDVLDSLDDTIPVVLANRSMRLGMLCGWLGLWCHINYDTNSLDISRDREVVSRMAVHR